MTHDMQRTTYQIRSHLFAQNDQGFITTIHTCDAEIYRQDCKAQVIKFHLSSKGMRLAIMGPSNTANLDIEKTNTTTLYYGLII